MNKIFINLLLFSTIVFGSIALLTFDAWADSTSSTDVYDIPQDYSSRNYVVQARRSGTARGYFPSLTGTGTEYDTYNFTEDLLYDFTVYFPSDYYLTLWVYNYNDKSNFAIYYSPRSDEERKYMFCFSLDASFLKFDSNNVACYSTKYSDGDETKEVKVYVKKNNATKYSIKTPSEHAVVVEDTVIELSSITGNFDITSCNLFSVNYPFVFTKNGSYNKLIYSGVYGANYVVQQFNSNTNDTSTFVSAIRASDNRVEVNASGVFPEPKLSSCKRLTSSLRCFYEYPTQGRTPNFNYVYPKIYVKVDGKDWVEYQEEDQSAKGFEHVFIFHVDNSNKLIWGSLSLNNLYIRMGYKWADICSDDFEPPKIQGIIWGVQYGYALTQNILDESSIRKSKIVFSRYVFEDNLVNTPDVGIGDLGDLPNISGSNSSIEVGTGGSNDRPSGGHEVPSESTSVIDWVKNFKFDFSSITNAIQGTFSLVTGFASMIGSIFQNFFGEGVAIVAMLAIGICVVLRLVGR